MQKEAVNTLYSLIQPHVPYILTAVSADGDESNWPVDLAAAKDNLKIMGTVESNPLLKKLGESGAYKIQRKAEGYSIKVFPNPGNAERFIIVIQGADDSGLLYGVTDFNRWYINHLLKYFGDHQKQYRRHKPFVDPALPFERASAPAVEYRGLWTWGHAIHDYRNYFKNMRECKTNMVIIWNDFVPVNARDVIEYAHLNGIKVIWGYSWCWGQAVNPSDPADVEKWRNIVLETYEKQYRDLKADGIYFQTFTETSNTKIGGASISDLVVDWVNKISKPLYEKYPDLWIQFGAHATSISEECVKFSAIDKRMSIIWEDAGLPGDDPERPAHCKGFPYGYYPGDGDDFNATLEYTRKLLSVRGRDERFGAIFKGFPLLDWSYFENQKGPFILGETTADFREKRAAEKKYLWDYSTAYWLQRIGDLKKICTLIANADVRDRAVTALVEDSMWENDIYLSAALLGECLWDPGLDAADTIAMLFHSGYKL
ncbi:MAG: hypothetical protein LBR86_02400 [Tannerella sp.]|nr:hypothetical protein [Tannerella sp.]